MVESAPVIPTAKMFAETVEGLVESRVSLHCSREHCLATPAYFARIFRRGKKASLDLLRIRPEMRRPWSGPRNQR